MDYIRIIPSVAILTFIFVVLSIWFQKPCMLHDVTHGIILTEHQTERIKVQHIGLVSYIQDLFICLTLDFDFFNFKFLNFEFKNMSFEI